MNKQDKLTPERVAAARETLRLLRSNPYLKGSEAALNTVLDKLADIEGEWRARDKFIRDKYGDL